MTTKQQQHLLAYLGYYTGQADGIWGNLSAAACKSFQADYGLTADGVCGADTRKMLIGAVSGMAAKVEKPAQTTTGTFWDEIPNFTRQEFGCKCGACGGFPAEPAEGLVRAAQALREKLGVPMVISSGVRCPAHNAEVGGVATSRHLLGRAMDFRAVGKSAAQVLPLAKTTTGIVYAYAINDSYVHMDIGGENHGVFHVRGAVVADPGRRLRRGAAVQRD